MKRNEIIEVLKKYSLDLKRYVVISGAAMVIYGFKEETGDIDIAVTKDYEEELLKNYNAVLENVDPNGNNAYMINDIINFGSNYYSNEREYVDGIPVQRVEDIIKLKKMLNRDKDIKDLESIYSHLQ